MPRLRSIAFIVPLALAVLLPTTTFAVPGDLDGSFGSGGTVLTGIGTGIGGTSNALVVQPDGKIVVAGNSSIGASVARLDPAGELDPGFGTDGRVAIPQLWQPWGARDVALRSNGKIIVVGESGASFQVLQLLPNGDVDTTFGAGGLASSGPVGSAYIAARHVVVQPNGKIIVVGASEIVYAHSSDFTLVRFNLNGSLDTTFGSAGIVHTDFGGHEEATSAVVQSDGKIVVAGGRPAYLARYLANGSLDPTFGFGGKVEHNLGGIAEAEGVALQKDGKIVIVGALFVPKAEPLNETYFVARFLPSGAIDKSFGVNGVTQGPPTETDARFNAVVIQSDGKIVAGGRLDLTRLMMRFTGAGLPDPTYIPATDLTLPGEPDDLALQSDGKIVASVRFGFAVFRVNKRGRGDSSFGDGGLVTVGFGKGYSSAVDAALQPDGKIVALARTLSSSSHGSKLVRYLSNGSLDSSFGTGGLADVHPDSDPKALAVQPDGKIVVVYEFSDSLGGGYYVRRFMPSGARDESFRPPDLHPVTNLVPADVIVQTDGKVVVAGEAGSAFALARFNPDGSYDMGFGTLGITTTEVPGGGGARAVVQVAGGKLIAAGVADPDFALVRYLADGVVDPTFGTAGIQTTSFGGDLDQAYAVAIQADGSIVAAGSTWKENGGNGTADFAVARFSPSGALDTTFGSGGRAVTSLGSLWDGARSVVIQADGRIVAAGSTNDASFGPEDLGGGFGLWSEFAVARFLPNGSLDTSFGTGGKLTTDLGGYEVANAAMRQSDGKIVLAGYSSHRPEDHGSSLIALTRYLTV
jgi:uncharacterized delta-60 repeat protein